MEGGREGIKTGGWEAERAKERSWEEGDER